MSDKNIDKEINSLVDQLKDNNTVSENIDNIDPDVPLSPEEIEQFVVQNSAKLITQSLQVMTNVKDYIMASNDPESVSALADLINASSKSIESLNKLVVQNKRSATSVITKQMDIDAKTIIQERDPNKMIGTREEIFKKLLTDATVIEADDVTQDSDDTTPDQ